MKTGQAQSGIANRRHRGTLIVLLSFAVLAVMALMGYLIWSGYREAIRTAETTSRNYAAIIEARLDATLRRADAHLLALVRELPIAALSKQAVPRYARALDDGLDSHLVNFPELAGLRVFDADGDMLYTTASDTTPRTHISDRSYFRTLHDNPQAGLVFSEVIIARTTGRQSIAVARALRDGQDVFHGIVFALIELEYFQTLFQSLDVGPRGVVAIHRSDEFSLVMRWPPGGDKTNMQLPPDNPARMALPIGKKKATVDFSSSTDGIARIYSFHVLERYPFFVTSALAREDVLAGWKARTLGVGLSGLLVLVLLASLFFHLVRAETRQAQAMADRVESERRHRDMVATIPGAVYEFRIDAAGHRSMLFASDGIVELTGLSPQEILADVEVLFQKIPAAAMPAMEQSLHDSLENLAPWLHEFPFRTTTGETKWLRGHSIPRREADGSTCWRGVLVDITRRKQTEEARTWLAAIVESSQDGIISRTPDGTILSWNAAAQRIFGYTAAEAVGRNVSMLSPPERQHELRDRTRLLQQNKEVPSYETVRIAKDGRRIDVEISPSAVRDDAGNLAFIASIFRDISERNRSDVVLRESEQRLRDVTEAAGAYVVETDLEYCFTYVSERAERVYGCRTEELLGRTPGEFMPPGELDRVNAWVARNKSDDGSFHELEHRTLTKSGEQIWQMVSRAPRRDANGNIVGYRATGVDITERKHAELALRASEDRYRDLVENSQDLICIHDLEGRLLSVNLAAARALGYSPDSLVGTNLRDLLTSKTREHFAAYLTGIRERGSAEGVMALQTAGGEVRYWEFRNTLREADVATPIVRGMARDITERRRAERAMAESEQRFRILFEQAAVGVAVVETATSRYVRVNQKFADILGYTIAELLQQTARSVTHRDDLPEDLACLERLRSGELTSFNLEKRYYRKDGSIVCVNITVSPMKKADGTFDHHTTVVEDITERKRAEAQRVALETQLRQAQKMEAIGTLAGGIAHDFNNILAAISGNVELARQDVGDQHPARASLDEIRKASRRAKELVDRILAFSRQQPPSRQPLVLAPVVEEAVKLLRATLPTGVALTATSADDAPNVLADPTQVHQIVLNLGTNAWHALEGNPGCIDIRVEGITLDAGTTGPGLQPGRYAHLSMRDTGCGMDYATLERVFDPFFTTKSVGTGTGLGLSVVHSIVQAHQGVIRIDSAPGRGTTVHVYFPAIEAHTDASTPAPEITAPLSGRGQHVLYLDDEEALVLLVTRMLERADYHVSGYTEPVAALAAVRADSGRFDLVVTDYNMPGMSGIDVAHELARIRPDLPVVITSGYIPDELRKQAERAGVRHLIYKPNTVEELCEAVRKLTDSKSPDSYRSKPG